MVTLPFHSFRVASGLTKQFYKRCLNEPFHLLLYEAFQLFLIFSFFEIY